MACPARELKLHDDENWTLKHRKACARRPIRPEHRTRARRALIVGRVRESQDEKSVNAERTLMSSAS